MSIIAEARKLAERQQENRGIPPSWAEDVKVDTDTLTTSGATATIVEARIVVASQKIRDKNGVIIRNSDGSPQERLRSDGTPWLKDYVFLRLDGGRWTVTSSPLITGFVRALAVVHGASLDCVGEVAEVDALKNVKVKFVSAKFTRGGKTWSVADIVEVDSDA